MEIDDDLLKDGLKFECTRCSICCRFNPGTVGLSQEDLTRLSSFLNLNKEAFIKKYCRYVKNKGKKFLSLKEKKNLDCIFWNKSKKGNFNACQVYKARPVQCSTFPFWPGHMNVKSWNELSNWCPGINNGRLILKNEIEKNLKMKKDNDKNIIETENKFFI